MNELSRIAASTLIASTWETAVLVLGLACALSLLPRISAATRYAVWIATLATAALLPLLSLHPAHVATVGPSHLTAIHIDARWSIALAALWLALSLLRAGQLIASAIRLHAIAQNAIPVADRAPCTTPGSGRTAILCTSDDVARPSVLGFWHPRILIPTWLFAKLSPAELDHVILHEMQHLRRRDDWVNLAQKIGLILFPLNPALVWVERRLCLERELACDDSVLELTNAPKAYATCLVNLAEHHIGQSRLSLALGAWERRSELAQRVHEILRLRSAAPNRRTANALTAALVLAIGAGATELSQAPQLVAFTYPVAPTIASTPTLIPSGYQPVVFHPEAQRAHATYLKAVMPQAAPTAAPKKPHHARPAQAAPRTEWPEHISLAPAPKPSRLTLTSFSDIQPDPTAPQATQQQQSPRVIFTVVQGPQSSHSYAAVPTPDGWLIFQL